MQRILATLLHYANAEGSTRHSQFYALKDRLLRKYGEFRGHELQEIKKDCWGDQYDDWGDRYGCGPKCRACGGSGVFDIRWVRLEIWHWQGFVFHRPDGDTRIPPAPSQVRIKGIIQHPKYGLKSSEARLWLYLLCGEWGLLWRSLRGSSFCRPRFWPMLNLQRIIMPTAMFFHRRTCWCGGRYWTFGSGWQICGKCRKEREARVDDGIPF